MAKNGNEQTNFADVVDSKYNDSLFDPHMQSFFGLARYKSSLKKQNASTSDNPQASDVCRGKF